MTPIRRRWVAAAGVVEERESEDGELVEVSRNFFAISARTGDVFYFGEDVDIWEEGRVVGHEGAWRAGVDGARAGLMMPGSPLPGLRHYQEVAPGVAMDRAEVLSVDDTVTVPASRFEGVLRVEETTPMEPWADEDKIYAPGVGLLRDGSAQLVRYGTPAAAGGVVSSGVGPCIASGASVALDHVIVAVPDLDAAAEAYRALGFTLKEGRLHPNGLLNKHVKLADGSELELMSLGREPRDDMARSGGRAPRRRAGTPARGLARRGPPGAKRRARWHTVAAALPDTRSLAGGAGPSLIRPGVLQPCARISPTRRA